MGHSYLVIDIKTGEVGDTAGGQGGWVAIHAGGGVGGEKEPLQGAIGG